MKKLGLIIFSLFIYNANSFAEFQCNSDLKTYAKELIKLELSGHRVSVDGQCLAQDKFKYVYSVQDPVGEGVQRLYYVKENSFNLLSVKPYKKKKNLYIISFSVTSKGREIKDEFVMWHREDKKYGCATSFSFPSKLFVYLNCQ